MADKSKYITRSGRITKRTLLNDSLRLGEKKKIKRAVEMNEAWLPEVERCLVKFGNSRARRRFTFKTTSYATPELQQTSNINLKSTSSRYKQLAPANFLDKTSLKTFILKVKAIKSTGNVR